MSGRRLLDDCVHCGFCLPACPTYQSWNEEADSPRGRIDLMRGLEDGALAFDAATVRHLDACLGCMACVPACPSGVKYNVLIEETRARIEKRFRRPAFDALRRALIFAFMPYPRRLRVALVPLFLYRTSGLRALVRRSGLLSVLPRQLAQLEALAPDVTRAHLSASLPATTPAQGPRRARVALLAGCVQRVFFPGVNEATIRVLSAEGCEVVVPDGQGCCGALSMHAGRDDEGKRFARALIGTFEAVGDVDAILVNAAGCGSNLKDYGRLLEGEPAFSHRAAAFSAKVRDVNEFLAALPPRAPRHPLALRVAYHDSCHLAHAQGIRQAPRKLLGSIPGLTLIEIPDGDMCCGSAGIYNLVQPASAAEIGSRKATNVLTTKADLLASANPGCTLQIGRFLKERGAGLPAFHPVEILDASLRGETSFPGPS